MSILITSVLNSASDRLSISSSLSSIFGALICSFLWAIYIPVLEYLFHLRGRNLGICQGGATHSLHCGAVCGGGVQEGTIRLVWLSAGFQSLTPVPTSRLGPSGGDSLVCGLVYISRTLWDSPTNSPVRLGVSPTAEMPTGSYSQRVWGFISPCWNPGLHGLSRSPVVPPSCSLHANVGPPGPPATTSPTQSSSRSLPCHASPPQLLFFNPPTILNECFLFNSLVVGLPYSLIFWQFWSSFVF